MNSSKTILQDKLLIRTFRNYSSQPIITIHSVYFHRCYHFKLAGDIVVKVNSGRGKLGRLIQDTIIAGNLNQTMINLQKSSKGLDEKMEALKHNIFLEGILTGN